MSTRPSVLRRPALVAALCLAALTQAGEPFLREHCIECHDAETRKGDLDLTAFKADLANSENLARWVKIHDRIENGEMPPKKKSRPPADLKVAYLTELSGRLTIADRLRLTESGRAGVRRLTRAEYENNLRDLLGLPGLSLQNNLPSDGSAHGFDKNNDALDISHVNLEKYMETADLALDMAIATRPTAPPCEKVRLTLAGNYEPNIMIMQGDAMLLRQGKPDPAFPPCGAHPHLNQGVHESMGLFTQGSSTGIFRTEDESWHAYFKRFAALYPGRYHVRASVWSMQWDKGTVRPSRGIEAARLSVVQFSENGRFGQPASYVVGYFDAPSLTPQIHDLDVWLNFKETIGFNPASLAHVELYSIGKYGPKLRTMGFTGPCVVSDWIEIEGPFHDTWPTVAHRRLFGTLLVSEFIPKDHPGIRAPVRPRLKQEIIGSNNQPQEPKGIWTVFSPSPLEDADQLLGDFLPKAFRRPVDEATRRQYVEQVSARIKAGDCFELAMRSAYRAALCSPDFLYLIEPADKLDDHALASRLASFLWNSRPDEALITLAGQAKLRDATVLDENVERLLRDPKSQRFVEDFLGQWLKLRQIGSNDPDKKLYPEFSPYLQDSMVSETRAFFREMLDQNLDATHLVKSDFAMLNEKLAVHYGINGVNGPSIRRVTLPVGHVRGPFLTQAAVLKITANGTTTSPVVRGAFVMSRLLGKPPDPPPANVPAVEPDVRGATTIRELLAKHRNDQTCATCHAKIDPPGFALESFDVIGGQRKRYRALDLGDDAPRGSIDPLIKIQFKLGPSVDPSGNLLGEPAFHSITELQDQLAQNQPLLLTNLAHQLLVYSLGRELGFSERLALQKIVSRTQKQGGGLRTLIHEVVRSPLFLTR